MAIFSSRTPRDLNHDPKPYTDIETPLRYIYAPSGTDYYFRYDPRPEFDHVQHNEPNPILVKFREFCGPDEWDIQGSARIAPYAESWVDLMAEYSNDDVTAWGDLAGLPEQIFAHARKVLSRLARLTE